MRLSSCIDGDSYVLFKISDDFGERLHRGKKILYNGAITDKIGVKEGGIL